METTRGLTGRVERLELRRPASLPLFEIHVQAGPDGRCLTCGLPDGDHFTITIDRGNNTLERRYVGIDLSLV